MSTYLFYIMWYYNNLQYNNTFDYINMSFFVTKTSMLYKIQIFIYDHSFSE